MQLLENMGNIETNHQSSIDKLCCYSTTISYLFISPSMTWIHL